jgi:hypothetical protein
MAGQRKTDPALDKRLTNAEQNLMLIARRQYLFEAFVKELNRASRLKPFRICNDGLWMVMLDSRDMLVIHLSSWVEGICGKAGLLPQLRAHHLAQFARTRWWAEGRDEEKYLADLHDRKHAQAFERLFPRALGASAAAADFKVLVANVGQEWAPLVADRNRNRAHPFEYEHQGSAAMLDLDELRKALSWCENLLNDLRLVGHGSIVGYHDMNEVDVDAAAEEIVESILLGTASRRSVVAEGRGREDLYRELHERHDALPAGREVLFNDYYD